jgi:trk system potassium uptake protein TrkH
MRTQLLRIAARAFLRASAAAERLASIHLLILGYASYVLFGWLVLCIPWSHAVDGLRPLDHLFMATSAVSTTGLVTISTADSYNLFGEIVILLLIQFGGLGYMTISSFTVLAASGDLSPLRERISAATLSLPSGFDLRKFLRIIIAFTVAIEVLGAAALYPVFVAHEAPNPFWQSIFHSVSAFCTAGFGLYNDSFESFRDDRWLNFVIDVLSFLGAIGFIVIYDIGQSVSNRKPQMTFTSRIILAATFWISCVGTILFALDEPAVAHLPAFERWMASLFQVMTASTTVGFNTIPIGGISASSLFLLTAIMVIGASPTGTGGGLKTTTFTALWAEMTSVLCGRSSTTFRGRSIPEVRMRAAVASAMFYALTLAGGIYLLALVEPSPLPDQMFECASALGTVGLSRGITAGLTDAGKWILIALMFLGRVGPVVIVMAFFVRRTPTQSEESSLPSEDVVI